MKDDINLITPRKITKSAIRKIVLISFIVFGSVFALTVASFFYSFFLHSTSSSLDAQSKSIQLSISGLGDRREKTIIIKDRLTNIQKILNNLKKVESNTSSIVSEIPKGIVVSGVNADDQKITLRLSSPSLNDLDLLTQDTMLKFAKSSKLGIKKIDSSSLSVAKDAYGLTLDFYFTSKVIKK